MVGKNIVEKIKKRKPMYEKTTPNPHNVNQGAGVIKQHRKNYDAIMQEINDNMSDIEREQKRKKKGM
jgi:hypothetical protein